MHVSSSPAIGVDHRGGSIFAATDNFLGWASFQLCAFVEGRFHLPVSVVNDAQAAALSELHFDLCRGLSVLWSSPLAPASEEISFLVAYSCVVSLVFESSN
jgi:hypothetical protein